MNDKIKELTEEKNKKFDSNQKNQFYIDCGIKKNNESSETTDLQKMVNELYEEIKMDERKSRKNCLEKSQLILSREFIFK